MKLWDLVFACSLLVNPVFTRPLFRSRRGIVSQEWPAAPDSTSEPGTARVGQKMAPVKDNVAAQHPQQFEDALDFIKTTITRLRRSTERERDSLERAKRRKRKGVTNRQRKEGRGSAGRRRKGTPSQGCTLRQIRLNVSDLGLGYQTKEEMIFRYCSGPCTNSETNYDKILNNLTQNRKLRQKAPPHACCRPISFDDDLSFLDDNLIYHTMKRHSARKCGCI
ncbi:glial cell line-derived neurotrophic factor isoform X2 [Denticeps clupeoides]|uniref:Glial cell line-derived neurotrophic factor n=2 Tax=Denticeps clupeoides TaxID=299321 RepID=A0AAY4CEP1_9TELE|nr:glial cell line-derived neurotrophic factor-like isoform X2 [Denticeps clupeoides]